MTTCMESSSNFSYMMLNLVGEVGELASKVAKGIRKQDIYIGGNPDLGDYGGHQNDIHYDFKEVCQYGEYEDALKKEAGDILWQLSGLCTMMGWELEDVARMNLAKLSARKEAGTIDGDGDGICGAERK